MENLQGAGLTLPPDDLRLLGHAGASASATDHYPGRILVNAEEAPKENMYVSSNRSQILSGLRACQSYAAVITADLWIGHLSSDSRSLTSSLGRK